MDKGFTDKERTTATKEWINTQEQDTSGFIDVLMRQISNLPFLVKSVNYICLLFIITSFKSSLFFPPTTGTTNFNAIANGTTLGSGASPASGTNSGWTFETTTSGVNARVFAGGGGPAGGAGDIFIRMDRAGGSGTVTSGRFMSDDGSEFKLNTLQLRYTGNGSGTTYTITGYKDNSPVSGAVLIQAMPLNTWTLFNVSADTDFNDIDEIRITGANVGTSWTILGVDDINISAAVSGVTPPSVPVVSHGPPIICSGNKALLTWTGNLNDATQWHIYAGSCGGTPIATTTGNSAIVSPPTSGSITYFVRGEGGSFTPGTCGSTSITITPRENANFSYSASSYLTTDADPTPTITGVTGGNFSTFPGGLSTNTVTGQIDVSASTPGMYTVTYQTPGLCSGTESRSITITSPNAAPIASSFTASNGPYENLSHAFSTGDFGYSDGDGDALDHVLIEVLPTAGTLYIDANGNNMIDGGEALSAGNQVSRANLDAGRLKYLQAGSTNTSFQFEVNDGTVNSTGNYVATLNVSPIPTVTLSLSSTSASESAASVVTVIATLSNLYGANVTVNLGFSGTATAFGVDYTPAANAIVINAGNSSNSTTFTVQNDAMFEAGETVVVKITSVTNGTENGTQEVTHTINNDDTVPSVSFILLPQYNPTNENGGIAYLSAELDAAAGVTVTVPVTFSGTATQGIDFSVSSLNIVIPAGDTKDSIAITGLNDAIEEGNESIFVDMESPTNGTEDGTQRVTLTLSDDDMVAPRITSISRKTPSTSLTNSNVLVFRVVFNEAVSNVDVTDFDPTGTTANATNVSGSGTTYDVTVSGGDLTYLNGTVSLGFAGGQNITDAIGTALTNTTPTGTNQNYVVDNTPPVFENSTPYTSGITQTGFTLNVDMNEAGIAYFVVVANGAAAPTSANVKNGQANGGGAPITADNSVIHTGTFVDNLSATSLTPNTAYDVYVVLEDALGNLQTAPVKLDVTTLAQPTISLDDVSLSEGNSGTKNFTFTVSLSTASSQTITVNYATSDGTAAAGSDYTAVTSTVLTFNPAETSKMVTVTVSGDTDFEPNETFTVNLSSPSNATINDGIGTGTIQNDDVAPPTITSVNIPNAAAKVGDAITVTIEAGEGGLTLNTGQVNGVNVTGFTNTSGSTYTATYTVAEGNTDRAAGDNIPVNFILSRGGVNSSAFTTPINQNADPIDANTPTAPSTPNMTTATDLGSSNTDNITSDNTPAFTGTAEANTTIILISSVQGNVGTATANGLGNWTITASTLNAGAHNITATATDVAGNTSSASGILSITIDVTAPGAPSTPDMTTATDLGSSNTDNITSDNTPAFTGTAEANTTIILISSVQGNVGTATANGLGNWTITASTLNAGAHNITATATDVAGNTSSASGILSITIDVTAPGAPSTPDMTAATDLGSSNTDNITSDNTPAFTGTAEANTTIILISSVQGNVGTATANGLGNWTITASTLNAGAHNITATATDVAGNTSSASGILSITIDVTAPGAPSTPDMTPGTDAGSSNTDNITNDATPTFTGTGVVGAMVELFYGGTNSLGTTTVDGSGNYSITTTAIPEGNQSITARQTDVAGNLSVASSALNITIDVTAPSAPGTPDMLPSSDTGISNTDNITNDATPTFTGTGEVNGTLELFDTFGGTTSLGTTTVNGAGNYTITSSTLTEGAKLFRAQVTDVAGNQGPLSGVLSATILLAAPVSTPSMPNMTTATDLGTSNTDNLTSDATPDFTGTVSANSMVQLFRGGTNSLGIVTADGVGNFIITATAVPEGPQSITARQTDAAGNLGPVSPVLNITIDLTAPTVSSVTVPANATYGSGQSLDFTVNFNDNVTVNTTGGTPQLAITIGSLTRQATYVTGSGSRALLFRYTIQAGDVDADGITVNTLATNSGTLRDAAGNDVNLTLNGVGVTTGVLVDTAIPTVTKVTSSTANGTYNAGDMISVQVVFSEAVTVTGTPQLNLETGSTDRAVNYTSGSGTNTLTFNYTVQAGDVSADLDYVNTTSLALNGGTIADGAGNQATLTLATPGAANSLGANKALVIDGIVPTVTKVTSSTANGTYNAGDMISVQVVFSEAITVTGTPQLTLETGSTDRAVNYTSGSGTNTLTFNYTVQAGDVNTDLDYVNTTSLTLNGGTIADGAGNQATLTLATPGAANSLGANKALVIDGVVPTVTKVTSSTTNGTYNAGDMISVQVVFSEAITVTGTPQLTLETGATDRTVNYTSGSGTNTLTFDYTVQAGDVNTDLDYVSTTSLALNGGTITDGAGNQATLTLATPGAANSLGANKALVIDGVVPTVTKVTSSTANGAYNAGDMISVQVVFSEAVTVTGTPQLTLETGATDRTVNYTSGSGTNTLTFGYTVQAGDVSADLDYVSTTSLALNGGTIADGAGNQATLTLATPGTANSLGANKALVIDGVAPTVASINRKTPAVSPTNANMVTFELVFNETVTAVDGSDFAIAGPAGALINVTGTGTTYDVTVSGGDMASLNGAVTLSFSGGQNITDAAGNALVNTAPTGTNVNAYVLDNTAPIITSFTRKTPNTQVTNVNTITFLATFSEDVQNVDLNDFVATGPTGASIVVTQLTASTYNVLISGGDLAALNGAVGLNLAGGASVTDLAGNSLTVAEPGTDETYSLDNLVPNTMSFTRKTPATPTTSADQLTFLATFNENVTGVDVADFTATGTTANIASVTQVTPSTYDVVVSGGDLATLNGTVGLSFVAGVAIADLAGNALPSVGPGTNQIYTLCNGPNNPVTGITLGTVTANSIPFTSFTAPVGGATGYVVKINDSNTFTPPTNGALPTASLAWAGTGEQVVYAGTSANPSIAVAGLASGITYYFKVFAYNDCGGTNTFESTGTETNTTTPKANQTIMFALGTDATKTFGDASFNLNGTTSSGLAITYASSNTAVATISGNTVTIVGAGSANITASQAGNTNFNAAPDVVQPLTVNKGEQTITFGALANQVPRAASFNLTAKASSGLAITYASSNANVATVSGNTVTIVGVGSTNITASQAGDANYNAAPDVVQPLTIVNAPMMLVKEGSNTVASGNGNYNFGNVDQGQSSTVTFSIENNGGADLVLNGSPLVAVSGANSTDFTVTQPTGATVAINGNITFQVVFTPGSAGAKTATINIASNDVNAPYTFALNGEGMITANNVAVPTLFTPNDDGNNDTFIISAPTLAKVKLKIFNRKGGVVYSSKDVNEVTQIGWNGISKKGTKLPTGNYIWQITGSFQDGTPVKRKTGEIYLVR